MNTRSLLRGLFAASFAASAMVIWAIAPEGNLVDNLNTDAAIQADPFNQVVRISTEVGNNLELGSGSVFMKHEVTVGNLTTYYLCVLTADHVIADNPNGVKISFQNFYLDNGTGIPPSGPLGGTYDAGVLGRGINGVGGDTPDIAVLTAAVPKAIWDEVNTPPVIPWQNNNFLGTFSAVGYGNTGTDIVDGSGNVLGYNEQNGTYGTKRYLNGTVDTEGRITIGPYTYDDLEWNVGDTEGTIMGGDSGSPMFLSNSQPVSKNSTATAYSTFIGGVVTAADDVNGLYYNDTTDIGVDLTDYATWINERCDSIPEPPPFIAAAIGFIVFARPRRKK